MAWDKFKALICYLRIQTDLVVTKVQVVCFVTNSLSNVFFEKPWKWNQAGMKKDTLLFEDRYPEGC